MANKKYTVVNGRGQIVIPAGIRERFAIRQGTRIAFIAKQGRLFIQPVTDAFIASKRGSLRKRGIPPVLERDPDREPA